MKLSNLQRTITELAGSPDKLRRPRALGPAIEKMRTDSKHDPPFRADEYRCLVAIAKNIDNEHYAALAWEMVADIETCSAIRKWPEHKELFNALAGHLHKVNVAYMPNIEDVVKGEIRTASGTLISIAGHQFVATAAHCLRSYRKGLLRFVRSQKTSLREFEPPIIRVGHSFNPRIDVGYIEIEPSFPANALDKKSVSLDRITPEQYGKSNALAYISGYPAAIVDKVMEPNDKRLAYNNQCYLHQPIMPEDWDLVSRSKNEDDALDPTIDVIVPYSTDEELMPGPTQELPEPHGLSGCGIWQPMHDGREQVWSPESYGLVAIQSSWSRKGGYLKAIQILHWLRLIWQDYENLRALLENHFGALKESM